MINNLKKNQLHFNKTIVLVGFMGTGKTTVGRLLAKKTGLAFYDTDALIEDLEGTSINDIFLEKGEEYFRLIESKLLRELLAKKQIILSTGGGIVKSQENRDMIKASSISVALKSSPNSLIKRLKGSQKRPLLQKENFEENLIKLYNQRINLYDFADIIISTERKTAQKIATEIYDKVTRQYLKL